ncbi:4-amino-4-deoxy-L-arabinose-phosphoundecaprenol flippase subunit ArnF [Scandinavium sp. V105_16]|uniref:4-amino-4-deoxy-L-arabinose-phosphoundecaprenol flippase subunit ArnF n=1 Tax=Scandinavium lactucae TaxID=3095028 RepID=A0AAJ2VRY8_9ENTR|nr:MULTISPECIES: 4-amino-4-deoxy-L-arabinose-phosphoundecaprenol flippase subunit ArnF [unclassified Scandinavium]MDX6019353.1 4-amino-4-deoxy-L-arabinose-phosphoundecaprenol flippase subunit ArnF [Scandinavium sp. V105_16]MDX6030491.1 4-amino-4-deoxy-L-arabinose-phosphoundecaprenol flippase subunit ArnF [Scandinavium sp. V105_12]
MGIVWALLSVFLVSGAQLLLRQAMLTLPEVSDVLTLLWHLLRFDAGTVTLLFGLLGYLASMVCWFFALRRLPLAKAYALLSLSYIAVWTAALVLQHEVFSLQGLAGVLLVMAGVMTIFSPPPPNR